MTASNVLPKPQPLTETDYRRLLAKGITRVTGNTEVGRFGIATGCGEKTMRNARDEKTSLHGATAFNMLLQDPTALDEILAALGFRLSPVEATMGDEARLLADTLALASDHAEAMADGRVDRIEEARLIKKARPVAMAWNARIARAGVA